MRRWIEKAAAEAAAGNTVVALLPARPDTGWWQLCEERGEITFITGRVSFTVPEHLEVAAPLSFGATSSPPAIVVPARSQPAPFPSAVVVFRPSLPRRIPAATFRPQP